jgi:aminoglycoside phosphotransferase
MARRFGDDPGGVEPGSAPRAGAPTRPGFDSDAHYAASLEDVGFWAPYAARALARHGLPWAAPAIGAVGTFPTLLVGRYVVKLFGESFFGPECHAAERSIHRVLRQHEDIPAPMLVAEGELFEEGWPWPYLITSRMGGRAWADAPPSSPDGEAIARRLGEVIRRVHALPAPAGPTWERDWLGELRARCADRHRERGVLPRHLVEQIPAYLAPPSETRRPVHADLHAQHIFVEGDRLVGIIDWGDAFLADPYYDLPALHLLTFRADKRLLRAFLEGYEWELGPRFAHRAMTMTLVHEFDPLGGLRGAIDVAAIPTLGELARRLWALER